MVSGLLFGGDKGAQPSGWGLAAMLRLLAAPKLVADSTVAPGIRIRAQARLERSSVTSRTELLPAALSLRRGRSRREMADPPPAAGRGESGTDGRKLWYKPYK